MTTEMKVKKKKERRKLQNVMHDRQCVVAVLKDHCGNVTAVRWIGRQQKHRLRQLK